MGSASVASPQVNTPASPTQPRRTVQEMTATETIYAVIIGIIFLVVVIKYRNPSRRG